MTRFRKEDELAWADAVPPLSPDTIAEYRAALVAARQPDGWESVAAEYRAIIEAVASTVHGANEVDWAVQQRGLGQSDLTTKLDAIEVNRLALK